MREISVVCLICGTETEDIFHALWGCTLNRDLWCTESGQVTPGSAILVLGRALIFQMSNVLSVCTAVGLFCLMGAYAARSTQHLKTSIYIFALVVVVLFVAVVLLLICLLRGADKNGTIKLDEEQGKKVKEKKWDGDREERKKHARRKYVMLRSLPGWPETARWSMAEHWQQVRGR
ncbi:hypothetical protein ZWY2020_020052 [Hordeum vulgare]|nr:hypothetical protein ZWY2020_020052 [Hordeum vulgare]